MLKHSILITGGAGFIGVNSAAWFAREGWEVTVLDDLSRRGSVENLEWLRRRSNVAFVRADVRDAGAIERVMREHGPFRAVLHLAAQVAVTTSVIDPRTDFEINALGTLNLLEAVRRQAPEAVLVYASTNKVYGKMDDVAVELGGERYRYADLPTGVPETRTIDFHSPYGCSKGAADQYVLDYARIYGLQSTSFRQSCIYGPRQFGIEDQGWVAWFAIAATLGRPLTIYGDGRQVRDVLHVEDLVRAYGLAIERAADVAGQAFNIGGGPENTLSLLELLALLEAELGRPISRSFAGWRPGDQLVYVSDPLKAQAALGWQPRIEPAEGVRQLLNWVARNQDILEQALK